MSKRLRWRASWCWLAPIQRNARGKFISGHSTAKMRLLGAALSNLHREGPLAWIWVTQEQMERFGARDEEDCEGLVNYALSMGDVQVAIFLSRASRPRYRVSLAARGRSTSRPLRSSLAAEATGALAVCSLEGPLAIAVSRVVERLRAETTMTSSD